MVRHDQLILIQKHVSDSDSLIQQAAGISPHVENQAIEARSVQLFESVRDFAVSCFIETGQTDVPNPRLEHESDVHRVPRYLVSRNCKDQWLLITFAADGD